jgi:hypothetical protein
MYTDTNARVEENGEGDKQKQLRELRRRIRNLYGDIQAYTGEPTSDQKTQIQFLRDAMGRI